MKGMLREALARLFPGAARRFSIPQRTYRDPSVAIRPVRGALRHTRSAEHFDSIDAFAFNLRLVTEKAPAGSVSFVRQSWPRRPVVEMGQTAVGALLGNLNALPVPIYLAWVSADSERVVRVGQRPRNMQPLAGDTITVFTPHVEMATGRTYGQEHGSVINVLTDEDSRGLTDEPASYVGVVLPMSSDSVTKGPFEVGFPIDVVYLWVDGNDDAWRQRRKVRLSQRQPNAGRYDMRAALYQSHDEVRYSLRSLERYAPWVRHVYLVTDDQRPEWLIEHPRLTVVDHRDFIPASALPTYNSHAITLALHHIDGIAEHFLALNDDVFFGRPIAAERMFLGNGTARFFLSRTPFPQTFDTDHDRARNHTADVIERLTGSRPTNVFQHTPLAFRRSLLASLEEELPEDFERTLHAPFRSASDVVPEYLHHYVGFHRRLALPGRIRYGYFGFGTPRGMAELQQYAGSQPAEIFCINDRSDETTDLEQARSILHTILSTQYPHPAPWEA